eukprot:361294-Chlamydomonas_euryale.AAC.2
MVRGSARNSLRACSQASMGWREAAAMGAACFAAGAGAQRARPRRRTAAEQVPQAGRLEEHSADRPASVSVYTSAHAAHRSH